MAGQRRPANTFRTESNPSIGTAIAGATGPEEASAQMYPYKSNDSVATLESTNTGKGTGLSGVAKSGFGVYGFSKTSNGVYGISGSSDAVVGTASSGSGVFGTSTNGSGVFGTSGGSAPGIYGSMEHSCRRSAGAAGGQLWRRARHRGL
jgi:hypothetical protein